MGKSEQKRRREKEKDLEKIVEGMLAQRHFKNIFVII